MVKMRGLLHALFAFKIFSLPIPTRPGIRTFLQVPNPSRPEVQKPYPLGPAHSPSAVSFIIFSLYLNSYSLFFVVLKIQCYDTLTMEIKILKMYGVNHRLPIAQS